MMAEKQSYLNPSVIYFASPTLKLLVNADIVLIILLLG